MPLGLFSACLNAARYERVDEQQKEKEEEMLEQKNKNKRRANPAKVAAASDGGRNESAVSIIRLSRDLNWSRRHELAAAESEALPQQ